MEFPITIAYNMKDKKVGCVLLQPLLGATCPTGIISAFFDNSVWDLSPKNMSLYTIRSKEEFNKVVEVTHRDNGIKTHRFLE